MAVARIRYGPFVLVLACSAQVASTEGATPPADGPCVTSSGTTTLATEGATGIAVDDSYVYFATIDAIRRVPRAGGAEDLLATISAPWRVAIDGANAYFFGSHRVGAPDPNGKVSSGSALYAVPLAGGDPRLLVDGAFAPTLAASEGAVIWGGPLDLEILAPNASAPKTVALPSAGLVEAIAVGAGAVYVAVYTVDGRGGGSGSIVRAAMDGTRVSTIVTGLGHPRAIALDESSLYVADDANSAANARIVRAGLDGGGMTTIANVIAASIAVDAHAVYFATPTSIAKVPKTGGDVTTIASGLESPDFLVVHGGNVYWANDTTPSGSDPHPPYAVMTACK